MSFYSRMEGNIKYTAKESFWNVYKTLRRGNWIDPHGYFLDEGGSHFTDAPSIDFESLTVAIPHFTYRNLDRVDFFIRGAHGRLIGTSSDGCFTGFIENEIGEHSFDLEKWAGEMLNDEMPDPIESFDEYCEWQSEVENSFFYWCNGALKV